MTEKFNAANDNAKGANDNGKFATSLINKDNISLANAANSDTAVKEGTITNLEKDFNLYAIDHDILHVLDNSPFLKEDLLKENISYEDFQKLLNKKVWTKMGEGESENGQQTWVLKVSQNSNLLTPQERVNYANLRIRIPVSNISAKPILVNIK